MNGAKEVACEEAKTLVGAIDMLIYRKNEIRDIRKLSDHTLFLLTKENKDVDPPLSLEDKGKEVSLVDQVYNLAHEINMESNEIGANLEKIMRLTGGQ